MLNHLVSASDTVLLLLAAGLSFEPSVARIGTDLSPLQILVIALLEATLFRHVMRRLSGYRVEHYTDPIGSILHLVGALIPAWGAGLVLLAAFAPGILQAPRQLIIWHLLQLMFLVIGRQMQRALIRLAERRRLLRRRVVIIGANPVAERVMQDLSTARDGGYEILAVFRDPSDGETEDNIAGLHVAGDLETLNAYAQSQTIDVVVLALPWSRAPDIFRLIESVGWIAADVVIPFDEVGSRPTSPGSCRWAAP
jgi:FlaA1/EpsC-like NDP-sugar epimerase